MCCCCCCFFCFFFKKRQNSNTLYSTQTRKSLFLFSLKVYRRLCYNKLINLRHGRKCMKCRACKWKHGVKSYCNCWISPHDKPTHRCSVGLTCLTLFYMTVVYEEKAKLGTGKCGASICVPHWANEDRHKGGIEGLRWKQWERVTTRCLIQCCGP